MLVAALRRFLLLALGTIALTAAVSLLFGLLAGGSANRSLVLGFYLTGCFLLDHQSALESSGQSGRELSALDETAGRL